MRSPYGWVCRPDPPPPPPNLLPAGFVSWHTNDDGFLNIVGQAFDPDVTPDPRNPDSPIWVRITIWPATDSRQARTTTALADQACPRDWGQDEHHCFNQTFYPGPAGWYTTEVQGVDANTGALKRLDDGLFTVHT